MTEEIAAPPEPRVEQDPVQAGPPKVDPETMVLRAKPVRAIRFRRGVLVGGAAVASLTLVATAWVAFRPTVGHLVVRGDDRSMAAKPPSDALGSGPSTYDQMPKLGPPLPGDLGQPILDNQRKLAVDTGTGSVDRGQQAAIAERDRRASELKAARESGVLVQSSGGRIAATTEAPSPPAVDTSPAETAKIGLDPEHDPNAQQRKADFVGATDKGGDANPHVLTAARSPYTLSAGSVIAASLITGLRSELPGLVTAQVTERVYDSATGRLLLIPQGARLIGSYDSVVAFGQRRALVVWQRIIMPDGSSLQIDNVPASDPSGYAGLADKVDFHTWNLLKGVALSTLLGVGSTLTITGESDLVQAIRESTQQNVARAGDQLTSRNLQIQPTITIRPGAPVRLVVHRDLDFAPTSK